MQFVNNKIFFCVVENNWDEPNEQIYCVFFGTAGFLSDFLLLKVEPVARIEHLRIDCLVNPWFAQKIQRQVDAQAAYRLPNWLPQM